MLIQTFLLDRGGNFGLLTALLATPLILAAGSAIDLSMAAREKTNMQAVADAAALAGARLYNGTNAAAAKAAAQGFLDGYAKDLPPGASYQVSMSGQTVQVSMNGSSSNAFMAMAGMPTTPIGVRSAAIAPLMPKSVTFKPTQAQGWWYKKVSIIVTRPGNDAEQVIGTVTYQPDTQEDGGRGGMVVTPSEKFELGKYSKLILQMEVKEDGCPLYHKATIKDQIVSCKRLGKGQAGYQAAAKFDRTLRTDDPKTSHHLFVDKVQMPKNAPSPLERLLECGQTIDHAWEDGGGFGRQDFFYTAKSVCAPDGEFVRLTQ